MFCENRSGPQINKAWGGLKWKAGHFVPTVHTSAIKTKPIKVDVAQSSALACPFSAEESRFSWIFLCLRLPRSLSPNRQGINHWAPHRLPRFCGLCVDVENAVTSARACAAHLRPLRMLISGKVRRRSERVTKGVLEKTTEVLAAHSATVTCSPTAFQPQLAVCLLGSFMIPRKSHRGKQTRLKTASGRRKKQHLLCAVRLLNSCGWELSRAARHWRCCLGDYSIALTESRICPQGRANSPLPVGQTQLAWLAFAFRPLSSIHGVNVHGTHGAGRGLDECPRHYREALEW